MSIYDKKEKPQRQITEEKIKALDNRLVALGKRIDDEPDMSLAVELIRLRTNLLYKREALQNRLSSSTKGQDVMNYNVNIVQ